MGKVATTALSLERPKMLLSIVLVVLEELARAFDLGPDYTGYY